MVNRTTRNTNKDGATLKPEYAEQQKAAVDVSISTTDPISQAPMQKQSWGEQARQSGGENRGNYFSKEYDNKNVATAYTIDWRRGNVQYVTMTADTTFKFVNPYPGMRCILHVAGAFTPTFPATVRFSGGSTPSATAAAGKKDIYSLVYSGKESLYDMIQSANFATT